MKIDFTGWIHGTFKELTTACKGFCGVLKMYNRQDEIKVRRVAEYFDGVLPAAYFQHTTKHVVNCYYV